MNKDNELENTESAEITAEVARLRAEHPSHRVVVLTTEPSWRSARAAFAAGANDYLPKNLSATALPSANAGMISKEAINRSKLLLVDNRRSHSDTVQEFLELRGYEVLTAPDAATAKALVASEDLALVIIDIRLFNEEDDNDVSGLTLAKQLDPQLPKLILTAFPSYQDVRDMLGPGPDGKPITVGFVAKQEGLQTLLTSIRLVLAHLPPTFKNNLLREFQAPGLWALREQIENLGARDSIHHLQAAAARTSDDLTALRQEAQRQAALQRKFGLVTGTLGLILLLLTSVSLLSGLVETGLAFAILSLLTEFIHGICGKREKQAYQRADKWHEELRESERDKNLLLLCEALENSQDRDEYRKNVIDGILLRRVN